MIAQHGGRATKHLYALGHQCVIAVGDGMAIDTVVLRMTVDEHQHLPCTARQAVSTESCLFILLVYFYEKSQ